MLGSWPLALLGGLAFYLLGRWTGPLIGLRVGQDLHRPKALAQPEPDFPALSNRWRAPARHGPFCLPPLLLLAVLSLAVVGFSLTVLDIRSVLGPGRDADIHRNRNSSALAAEKQPAGESRNHTPPLGFSLELGMYLFGDASINTPAIVGFVDFFLGPEFGKPDCWNSPRSQGWLPGIGVGLEGRRASCRASGLNLSQCGLVFRLNRKDWARSRSREFRPVSGGAGRARKPAKWQGRRPSQ